MIALDLLDPYFSTDLSSILKKVQEVLLAIHLLSPWASYLSLSKYSA
jgi:hypothetical protein